MNKITFELIIRGVIARAIETLVVWGCFNFMIAPCFNLPQLDFIGCAGVVFIFRTLKD